MATPLGFLLAGLGGLIAWGIQDSTRYSRQTALVSVYPFLAVLLLAEAAIDSQPLLRYVKTEIEIVAFPEKVWSHVIQFSELPPPREWIFHTGIAFPVRARIEGSGIVALRYCEFSTGAFIEPITTWDPPRRLAFDVREQPHAMQEWSLWGAIVPRHLDSYFQSVRGEFVLEEVKPGVVRLAGTTWYKNRMWPASYWNLWSDAIVHAIHMRVLEHIRDEVRGKSWENPGHPPFLNP